MYSEIAYYICPNKSVINTIFLTTTWNNILRRWPEYFHCIGSDNKYQNINIHNKAFMLQLFTTIHDVSKKYGKTLHCLFHLLTQLVYKKNYLLWLFS